MTSGHISALKLEERLFKVLIKTFKNGYSGVQYKPYRAYAILTLCYSNSQMTSKIFMYIQDKDI